MVGEETIKEMEQADVEDQHEIREELDVMDGLWEQRKSRERAEKARSSLGSNKLNQKRQHREHEGGGKPSKRRKRYEYELVGKDWGETTEKSETTTVLEDRDERMVTHVEVEPGAKTYRGETTGTVDGQGSSKDGQGGADYDPPVPPATDLKTTPPMRAAPGKDGHLEYVNRSIQENVCMSVSMMKECKIVDGVCCNGCIVKNIQISSKKRTQNKKTKLWYDRTVKITKPICVRKKPGSRTGSGMMGSELGKEGDLRLDQI